MRLRGGMDFPKKSLLFGSVICNGCFFLVISFLVCHSYNV